jgi:hypothetical protein
LKSGVREISGAGDSQIRGFLELLVFQITGLFTNHGPRDWELALPMSQVWSALQPSAEANATSDDRGSDSSDIKFRDKSAADGGVLWVRFYWVDGVFKNGEHGCWSRGFKSRRPDRFPRVANSTDLLFMNAAAWTAVYCQQPVLAYSSHLHEFLQAMEQDLKPQAIAIFLAPYPYPHCQNITLDGKSNMSFGTNSLSLFQSEFARLVVDHHPRMHFMDSWEVIAPLYQKSCKKLTTKQQDLHYICTPSERTTVRLVRGVVGRALAMASLSFAARLGRTSDEAT